MNKYVHSFFFVCVLLVSLRSWILIYQKVVYCKGMWELWHQCRKDQDRLMGQLTTNKQLAVDIIKSTVTLRQYQQFANISSFHSPWVLWFAPQTLFCSSLHVWAKTNLHPGHSIRLSILSWSGLAHIFRFFKATKWKWQLLVKKRFSDFFLDFSIPSAKWFVPLSKFCISLFILMGCENNSMSISNISLPFFPILILFSPRAKQSDICWNFCMDTSEERLLFWYKYVIIVYTNYWLLFKITLEVEQK